LIHKKPADGLMLAIQTVDSTLHDGSDEMAHDDRHHFTVPGLTADFAAADDIDVTPGPAAAVDAAARAHQEILSALLYIDEPVRPAPSPQLQPLAAESFEAPAQPRPLIDTEADPGDDFEAWHLPPPGIHTTGTQLRRRLVTAESIAELDAVRPTLLQRLLRRT
jgi:hypothetical protein